MCMWGHLDKYIRVATWPPQTKFFLSTPGLNPSIYKASDSTPHYIRYSQHFLFIKPKQYWLFICHRDLCKIFLWLLNFVFMQITRLCFFFFFFFFFFFCEDWNLVVKLILKRLKLRLNARLKKWIGYLDSIHFHLIFRLLAQRRTKKERWGRKKFKAIAVIL